MAGLGRQGLGGAGLGEVGRQHPVALAGQALGQRLESIALAGAEQELGPAIGKRFGDRTAKSPGRAGEQGLPSGKFHPRAQASSDLADRIQRFPRDRNSRP